MDLKSSLTLHVNFGLLEEEAQCMAYLRGAFLAGGSVTDPAKRYHLEMTTSHYKVSRETCTLFIECGFSPKELMRGGNNILYFKQSDYIEDFLTAIGAQVAAMGVMEAKVEKDLRNGVNRRVNCETANLTKVVDASMGQMAAIRALEAAGELEKLPGKLKETALLRRENPEATLQELAAMLNPPITKSAINHRMRKLLELARAEAAAGTPISRPSTVEGARKAGMNALRKSGVISPSSGSMMFCDTRSGTQIVATMARSGAVPVKLVTAVSVPPWTTPGAA